MSELPSSASYRLLSTSASSVLRAPPMYMSRSCRLVSPRIYELLLCHACYLPIASYLPTSYLPRIASYLRALPI